MPVWSIISGYGGTLRCARRLFGRKPWLLCENGTLYYVLYLHIRGLSSGLWPFEKRQTAVTEKLLKEMANLANTMSSKLLIHIQDLRGEKLKSYKAFMDEQGISFCDGSSEVADKSKTFPDGHPNALGHKIWSEKLMSCLEEKAMLSR